MTYPQDPGHVNRDTSIAAAAAMKKPARSMQARIMERLATVGPCTASNFRRYQASAAQLSTVRARFAELCAKGLIIDSGFRGRTDDGNPEIIWRLTTPEEAAVMGRAFSVSKLTKAREAQLAAENRVKALEQAIDCLLWPYSDDLKNEGTKGYFTARKNLGTMSGRLPEQVSVEELRMLKAARDGD